MPSATIKLGHDAWYGVPLTLCYVCKAYYSTPTFKGSMRQRPLWSLPTTHHCTSTTDHSSEELPPSYFRFAYRWRRKESIEVSSKMSSSEANYKSSTPSKFRQWFWPISPAIIRVLQISTTIFVKTSRCGIHPRILVLLAGFIESGAADQAEESCIHFCGFGCPLLHGHSSFRRWEM